MPLPPISGKQAMPIRRRSLVIWANIRVGRIVDCFPRNKSHARPVRLVDVILLARTANIVGAVNNALHPSKSGIASRADLLGSEALGRHFDEFVPAFVQPEFSITRSRPDDFALIWEIDEIIVNRTSG